MHLVSGIALKAAMDNDPTAVIALTRITCYGLLIGPYPIIDFEAGTLIYEELGRYERTATQFTLIDFALAHILKQISDVPPGASP